MEELLMAWGMPDTVIKDFTDNGFNIDNLALVKGKPELVQLIPQLGLRLTFESKLVEWMLSKDMTEATTSTLYSDNDRDNDTGSSNNEKENQEVPSTSVSPVPIVITENTPIEIIGLDTEIHQSTFTDFHLQTLLMVSPMGKSILKYYETFNNLSNSHQNKLVDIIITHIYTFIVKSPLRHEDYNRVVAKIIELFPNEATGTYYVPPLFKSQNPLGVSQKALGKLPNRVRNIRFRSGDTRKLKKVDSDEDHCHQNKRRKDNEILCDINVQHDIIWLQNNVDPWEDAISKWKNTFIVRRASEADSVEKFLQDWPILKDLRADTLINLDFQQLFPEATLNFHVNWNNFMQKIISKRGGQLREAQIELKNSLEDFEGDKVPAQLELLNYMVPPTGKLMTNKTVWKFSTLDSIQGLYSHVKEPGDIERIIADNINKAFQRKKTLQPYLIFVGPTLLDIRQAFIVVDKIRYQYDTCGKALDILFKIFHVLHARYPVESEHIYTLIQKAVYKIDTVYDKRIPSIMDLLHQ